MDRLGPCGAHGDPACGGRYGLPSGAVSRGHTRRRPARGTPNAKYTESAWSVNRASPSAGEARTVGAYLWLQYGVHGHCTRPRPLAYLADRTSPSWSGSSASGPQERARCRGAVGRRRMAAAVWPAARRRRLPRGDRRATGSSCFSSSASSRSAAWLLTGLLAYTSPNHGAGPPGAEAGRRLSARGTGREGRPDGRPSRR